MICPDAEPVLRILENLRDSIIVDLKVKHKINGLIDECFCEEDARLYANNFDELVKTDWFGEEYGWLDFPNFECEEIEACLQEINEITNAIGILHSLAGSAQRYESLTIARDFIMGKI